MARGKQFTQLVSDLRADLGRNNDPGVRAADLAQLQQTISRVYETLYRGYDWPHLREIFDRIPLSAGERYYDFPDEMDFDRMEEVVCWYNNQPIPLERGIEFSDYATYDSENDVRSDPVVKWDVRFTGSREQIEVWPVPAGNTQAIQFKGIKKFVDLVDDADKCLLDDNLVVLTAAIELETDKVRRASKVSSLAGMYPMLTARSKGGDKRYRIGLGRSPSPPPGRVVVRVSGG